MVTEQSNPWKNLSSDDVTNLVRFYDPEKNKSLNDLQTTGAHALWNTLCRDDFRFAYLADEVGMGKTYQALGVIGILKYLKPDAKILILCPGLEMQKQWSSDWHSFFQEKFCPTGIDRNLKSCRIDANSVEGFESRIQPQLCDNLREFAAHLVASQHSTYLLRYSSFSLPLRVFEWPPYLQSKESTASFDSLVPEFKKIVDSVGCFVSKEELAHAKKDYTAELSLDEATSCFLGLFIKKLALLIKMTAPDLIVWDEAQYLRTDATRNDSMSKLFGKELFNQGCRHLFLSATPAHRDVADMEKLNRLFPEKKIQIPKDQDFRTAVDQWMVRRERMFNGLGKIEYREYECTSVDMFAEEQSPLYALTFAAMQKKLVELLDGENNRFRMGEISSNESARSSIERIVKRKQEPYVILEESSKGKQSEPIDEKFLQKLGDSFKGIQNRGVSSALGIPHAKVDRSVKDLAEKCLRDGTGTKELVFVRRIDTVDELADRLLHEFQGILNSRIRDLGVQPSSYWKLPQDQTDDADISDAEKQGEISGELSEEVENLPYFRALSAVKGNLGRLTVYRNTLGKENSTIRFLFAPENELKENDKILWNDLLNAIGISSETDPIYTSFLNDSNKQLLLRRCIGHSIRFTDILVDLDVLRQKNRNNYVGQWIELLTNPNDTLKEYFKNTQQKLRAWIDHFDVIVNKCFKDTSTNNSYAEIAERISKYFVGLSPVARRSGRRREANVVPQFKFPIYPNILICTDVLREGVNLHLFCERVSHYGIAWNSGDLEQRIGRVERADSLFERNILRDGEQKLPVGFPYLARTLDERQVFNALNKKREIDSLFSIVPIKETGECSDERVSLETAKQIIRKPIPIIPLIPDYPSIGNDWEVHHRSNKDRWLEAMREVHHLAKEFIPQNDFKYTACRMIGDLGLIAICWERLSKNRLPWSICDKMIHDTFERRKQWKILRTLYLPVEVKLTLQNIQSFWNNSEKFTCGSSESEDHAGFTYCNKINTHTKGYQIPHPFEEGQQRNQQVHILKWGGSTVLTSNVCDIADIQAESKKAELFVSEINQHLPIGCATVIDQQIVLSFPLINSQVWSDNVKGEIQALLAHWADRHQWMLMDGKDDEDLEYYPLQVSGVNEMNTSEAIDVLRSVKKWCESLNEYFDGAVGYSCAWSTSNFNKIISAGTVISTSSVLKEKGEGKFQIGYQITGLIDSPIDKSICFYLSGKGAINRVVTGDMLDIKISMADHENWLVQNGFTIKCASPLFLYAYADHSDGNKYRRVRICLPVSELEVTTQRVEWVKLITDIAFELFQNKIFRYNQARKSVEDLIK